MGPEQWLFLIWFSSYLLQGGVALVSVNGLEKNEHRAVFLGDKHIHQIAKQNAEHIGVLKEQVNLLQQAFEDICPDPSIRSNLYYELRESYDGSAFPDDVRGGTFPLLQKFRAEFVDKPHPVLDLLPAEPRGPETENTLGTFISLQDNLYKITDESKETGVSFKEIVLYKKMKMWMESKAIYHYPRNAEIPRIRSYRMYYQRILDQTEKLREKYKDQIDIYLIYSEILTKLNADYETIINLFKGFSDDAFLSQVVFKEIDKTSDRIAALMRYRELEKLFIVEFEGTFLEVVFFDKINEDQKAGKKTSIFVTGQDHAKKLVELMQRIGYQRKYHHMTLIRTQILDGISQSAIYRDSVLPRVLRESLKWAFEELKD